MYKWFIILLDMTRVVIHVFLIYFEFEIKIYLKKTILLDIIINNKI